MATITAAGNGNWSVGGTWTGGSAPGVGDTADSNGYTVTIDQDVTCVALINSHATTGGFSITAAHTITANITASAKPVLTATHTTGTVTIIGTITGGSATNAYCVYFNGAGAMVVQGNITGGAGAAAGIQGAAGCGALTVTGDLQGNVGNAVYYQGVAGGNITITGDIHAPLVNNGKGLRDDAANTVVINGAIVGGKGEAVYFGRAGIVGTINGNITGSSETGTNASALRVVNGTITVNGNITSGNGSSGNGAYVDGGTLIVNGIVTGSNYGPGGGSNETYGIYGFSTATSITVRQLVSGAYGAMPVRGQCLLTNEATNTAQFRLAYDGATKTLTGGTPRGVILKG